MRHFCLVPVVVALLAAPACGGSRAARSPGEARRAAPDLAAWRGGLQPRFLLSGELRAVRSHDVVVPRSPSWQVQIRWMERDGVRVEAGQKVIEFDLGSFVGALDERRLAVSQALSEIERHRAAAQAAEAEARFDLEQKSLDLGRARIEAAVPGDLLALREHQDRQLRLRRAEVEFEKARDALEAQRTAARQDEGIKELELVKARRELAVSEQARDAFLLTAPRAGILVVNDHPWEGRKLQVGDSVWAGLAVMSIPDLGAMEVKAQLSDVDDGRIVEGMRTVCVVDAWPDLSFPGVVREVTPIAQELDRRSQRRAFEVRIALDASDAQRMRPGMSVKVEVAGPARPPVLLAPRAALDLSVDPPQAILPDGSRRDVQLGDCDALACAIESGLAEGERLGVRG